MIDLAQGHTRITRAKLRPGRLWLLAPMLLALLMPYALEQGTVTPSLASALWNEAGVTYCMITPVVLGSC